MSTLGYDKYALFLEGHIITPNEPDYFLTQSKISECPEGNGEAVSGSQVI